MKETKAKERMEALGFDATDNTCVKEWLDIWYGWYKSPKISGADLRRIKSAAADEATAQYKINCANGMDVTEALFECRKVQMSGGETVRQQVYQEMAQRDPRYVAWRKFFAKYRPDLIEGMSAPEAKAEINRLFNSI